MKEMTRRRKLLFMGVGLLIAVVLGGCNQSASPGGESIDSALGQDVQPEKETRTGSPGEAAIDAGKLNSEKNQNAAEAENVASKTEQPVSGTTGENSGQQAASGKDAKQGEAPAETKKNTVPVSATDGKEPKDAKQQKDESEASSEPEQDQEETKQQQDHPANPEKLVKEQPFAWDGDNKLTFSQLYASFSVRGVQLSDKVKGLTGREVEMKGYMAPPLKAEVDFFVLTKIPLAVCPFCSSDADWPSDIVVVYMPDGETVNPTEHPVKVTGTLDSGIYEDEDTGFVSLIRIYADKVEVLKD